jgi:hypothetical protein
MGRPTYETAGDLADEESVARELAKAWASDPFKLPKFYKCDWAFSREGTVRAFIEIKCRKNLPNKYPTVIISADKWAYLRQLDEALEIPALLVFKFSDGSVFYIRPASTDRGAVIVGGRHDRGDPEDAEPVVHIPIEHLSLARGPKPESP